MYPRRDGAPLAAPCARRRSIARWPRTSSTASRGRRRQKLFVGPHLHLRGPRAIVVPLVHHDDHMHVRIANPRAARA